MNQLENGKNPGSQVKTTVNHCITSSQSGLNGFRVSDCAGLDSGNVNKLICRNETMRIPVQDT